MRFRHPAPNLSADGLAENISQVTLQFEAVFVTVPAEVNPGLGPVYNNISCINCHARDGRGRAPNSGEKFTSMLFRVSLPNPDGYGTQAPVPVPGFGTQLNNRAIFGVSPEGDVRINYTEGQITTSDGAIVHLRTPNYTLVDPYQPLPGDVELSPRVAPAVFGLGLLEAIPEATILAMADETDSDGDGISGKAELRLGCSEEWAAASASSGGRRISRRCFNRSRPPTMMIWALQPHCLPWENSNGQPQHDATR